MSIIGWRIEGGERIYALVGAGNFGYKESLVTVHFADIVVCKFKHIVDRGLLHEKNHGGSVYFGEERIHSSSRLSD